ncbi:SH3 domain-containing protein [Patescibacteria group bacterium]|nr:SH3 domain-containing protein [Patescibacteria group bacterium]
MRKFKAIGLTIFAIAVVVVVVFFLLGALKPKMAGIFIETNPASAVFINGVQVGRTPYRDTREPGEVVIKLIPESFQTPLAPYETKTSLVSGVETVIKRDFGEFESTSAGEIISFEKVSKDQTSLVVISIPNSAQLLIDGYQKSITPDKISSISEGEHILLISASGYLDRSVKVKTHTGYKLTAVIQLAMSDEETEQVEEKPDEEVVEEEVKPKVKILETSVGFLRVRNEPSTLGAEVGQVEPGDIFELLEIDEKTGWYKIEYLPAQTGEEGEEGLPAQAGWISNQYAEELTEDELEVDSTTTLSPTPKPTQ